MDAPAARGRASGASGAGAPHGGGDAVGRGARRSRRYRERGTRCRRRAATCSTSAAGAAVSRAGARVRRDPGRRLLDSGHPALRRHAARRRSATRPTSLLYPLLDLTTTLDPHFNIAYRFGAIFLSEPYPAGPGPGRPGHRAARARARRRSEAVAVRPGRGLRPLLVAAGLQGGRRVVRPGVAHRGRTLVAALDGRHDAGRGRRPPVVAPALAAALRDHRRQLGEEQRAAEARAARRARRDRRAGGRGPALRPGARKAPGDRGANSSRSAGCAGIPLDPSGTPYELRPDAPGGVALSEQSTPAPACRPSS